MKQEVIDLSQSDSEDEIEKKTKVEEVKAETQAKSQDQEAETEAKARVSISDQETVKKYRLMLEQSPDYLDTINEDLLPRLANTVSMIKGKALEWQDQVTVVYLGDPDSDFLLPQVQLQLLKSEFFYEDKGETKWIEVVVVADPVHCQLQVLSRMMGAPEHDLALESRVALPRTPTAEALHNVCVLVEEAFVEIFSDIYCEEEEEEELKTPVKKAKPATLVKDTDDEDSSSDDEDDDNDDEDEPMPPVQAKTTKNQARAEKEQGTVPHDLYSAIKGILEKGLFRRNDYGYFLTSVRSAFHDSSAWEDMLDDNSDPKFDGNSALCERRRLWARVTNDKSPATDKELLEMVRQYNVACMQLQAQRLDCIEELKALRPKIQELCKSSAYFFNWTRYWSYLANSVLNLDNLCNCIALGIYPTDYTWQDVRGVLEDRMLAEDQKLPPLDSTIVYESKAELESMKEAWKPVEARIKKSAFATSIL